MKPRKLLKFLVIFGIVLLELCSLGIEAAVFAKDSQIDADAKVLYNKIDKFLKDNENCPPEDFDKICSDYILKDSKPLKLENKDMLQAKAGLGVVLYRGISNKKFAEEMKMGKIHIASGLKNVRGSGIYTTPNLALANRYKTSEGEVLTMLLDHDAKVLENSYLEKLKQKVTSMNPQKFTFGHKNLIYDSMEPWINKQFGLHFKGDYEKFSRGEMCDWKSMDSALEKIKKHPEYLDLSKNRKRYYINKTAAVFNNSGLLAKFLSYDALHSKDFLWDSADKKTRSIWF